MNKENNMKKYITIFIALLTIALLGGCSSEDPILNKLTPEDQNRLTTLDVQQRAAMDTTTYHIVVNNRNYYMVNNRDYYMVNPNTQKVEYIIHDYTNFSDILILAIITLLIFLMIVIIFKN